VNEDANTIAPYILLFIGARAINEKRRLSPKANINQGKDPT
jgi:hypothetical protein